MYLVDHPPNHQVLSLKICDCMCRAIMWQITPYTVVLSKVSPSVPFPPPGASCLTGGACPRSQLGEAINYSPPYIEDAAMTKPVGFKRDVDKETGKEVRETAGETIITLHPETYGLPCSPFRSSSQSPSSAASRQVPRTTHPCDPTDPLLLHTRRLT
jgi:hypothetical protein